jgi:hypothetical protein
MGNNQALVLSINKSTFADWYVSEGSGSISSEQPMLTMEDSNFKNCTIDSRDSSGCFIWQRYQAVPGTSLSVIGCEFDNENLYSA